MADNGFFARLGNLWRGFLSLWISGIEQDHATGICRSYRIDYRRRARKTAYCLRLIRVVVPRAQTAMNVSRRDNNEVD